MKALLIIDMQKALFIKKTAIYKEIELLANINLLIRRAERRNAAIVLVRHCNDTFLKEGTPDWQLNEVLTLPESAIYINKHHGSCFRGTGLKEELKDRGINSIVVTGLVTNGCVQASSLDAILLGYDVTLISDGHSTYAKDAASLIDTWNERICDAGAHLEKAADVSFE